MSWVRRIHSVSLLLLFLTGIVLLYQGAMWSQTQNNTWIGTAALVLVGGSCICLALFGQKKRTEGVVAATIVSAFWTVAAAVAFEKEEFPTQAWTLLAAAIIQVFSSILGSAFISASEDEGFPSYGVYAPIPHSQATRNYGALSSFIDPLSTISRPRPASGSQTSLGSNASATISAAHATQQHSPLASPHILGRTPSPFGSASSITTSPHKFMPTNSLATLSAAAATPKETPEDIKQSYKALWEKYDLDS